MPLKCCVVNCSMRGDRDKGINFYRFPMIPTKRLKHKQLAEERQLAWLRAIKRKDLKQESLKYTTVCSKHFISGKSAKLVDKLNVDWVPTVALDCSSKIASRKQHEQTKIQTAHKEDIAHIEMKTQFIDLETQNMSQEKACQTEAFYIDSAKDEVIAQLRKQNNDFIKTIKQLKEQNFTIGSKIKMEDLKSNQEMTKYYTGFNDFATLEVVFDNVKDSLPITLNEKMNKFDVFLMAFMKLRLDLPFTHLAYQYQISNETISILFHKAIVIIYNTISGFVFWPDYETFKKKIPKILKELFGMKPVFIVDCFEISSEKPGYCLSRTNIFSNYKHHQTLKYLICISSFGSISFISKGYGAQCSNKCIFESCGILDHINAGDIILADGGVLIEQASKNKKTRLIMPWIKNGESQLESMSMDNNHQIANLRFHVERFIGILRQNLLVTTNRHSIPSISKHFNENMYFDYIIKISCAVFNLNPSIIN